MVDIVACIGEGHPSRDTHCRRALFHHLGTVRRGMGAFVAEANQHTGAVMSAQIENHSWMSRSVGMVFRWAGSNSQRRLPSAPTLVGVFLREIGLAARTGVDWRA